MLLCLHSIIYCKFYTLNNQSLLLWRKYLESLGKSNIFHIYFLQYVMEDKHTKEPLHNNPEEAADYVKAVNLLLQSFVNDIRGFNHYKHQDAYKTFLHTLSQLLSKLDSAYFTNMDQTKYVSPFLHILRKQQTKYSNVFPVTVYQQAPKLHPKWAYKETYHILIKRDNKPSPDYLATFKMHTTTCQK